MNRIAFMFPGVGSQYTGMGKSFFAEFPAFRQTMEEAEDVLAMELRELCFNPEKTADLSRLGNAQCALLAVSFGIFRVFLQETGLEPFCCLGHSLGEYTALCAAGMIRFSDALKLVEKRAEIITSASANIDATMAWVINLDYRKVEEICQHAAGASGKVFVSAYDAPDQSSVSGYRSTIYELAKIFEKEGAIVYPLNMSGPFHSPLMADAARAMHKELKRYSYTDGNCQVLSNYTVKPYEGPAAVLVNLSEQLVHPVRWSGSVRYLLEEEIEYAIEMGPKEVLKFLLARNTDRIIGLSAGERKHLSYIKEYLSLPEEEYLPVIGKCLGAIVSSPNLNHEAEDYTRTVSGPFQLLKDLYQEGIEKTRKIGFGEVTSSIGILHSILDGKRIPRKAQREKLKKALGGRILIPKNMDHNE